MEQAKLERINALARKAKQQSLTAQELAERDALRKEYIAEVKKSLTDQLDNTYLVDEHGHKEKLKKRNSPSQPGT